MAELDWYALKIRTRSETVALASLDYYGFESYCPQVKTQRKYSDRLKSMIEPVFPGYLFCRFALASKSKVLSSNAVEGIVGFGSQPAPLAASEIEAVRRTVDAGGAAAPVPKVGARVRVVAGSLRGVEGVLVRENGTTNFVVSIQLLQRSVSLSIEQSAVEGI
ncbi:MAG: hypothetical protein M3Y27_12570 [Acidobacteriota bacterium]|nr:hypothetical protein [Acidobacteriota bacterium]